MLIIIAFARSADLNKKTVSHQKEQIVRVFYDTEILDQTSRP